MFGGPGAGYLENDDTVVGDVPNFPGAKVVGGYDFAGNEYDATPSSINFEPIPTPDPDPMDCYSFGHGTHVAGTAAGYGVRQDGATYDGPYNSSMSLTGLRIGPGLAPEAAIYALKVFGCSGSSNVVDAAVEWAVDPNQDGDFSDHVDVINLSLGSPFGATFDATAVAVENAAKVGIIVVTSAGNSGDVHYAVGSPGIAPHAIAVAATSIDSTDPENFIDGSIASFSARGPRRGDDGLKPDLAAPGVNVVSAKRGTGSQSTTSSGTSMASPVVAGIMALLRQAHPEMGTPGWNSQELKALVMNTAAYPVLRADSSGPYSLLRAGAGRVDPTNALKSHLIAYDATAPAQVSVSFGVVEALDNTNELRAIRLTNKSTAPISVTVAYSSVSELAGVTIEVGVGRIITIPALGAATIPITLTIHAAELARHPDPARQVTPADSQPWVDEASGYVSFTPMDPESGPAIHLPILALPRAISALEALSPPLVLSATVTTTFPLTITGAAINATLAPTHSVPLVGLFGLLHSSPPITQTIDGEPPLGRYAQADLRYLGVAGPLIEDDEPMLYFALVSYGAWSTPLDATYQIAIDTNGDDITDFILQNRESTDLSTFDLVTTDDFVSLLQPAVMPRKIQGPLNIFLPTQYDTRPYDNNVMVLPLHLNQLGSNVKSIQLQVTSSSRDLINTGSSTLIEQTPTLSLRLADGAGVVTDQGLPLFAAASGQSLTVTIDRTAYVRQNTEGLLLLYLHNELSTRSQVLAVDAGWPNHQILPIIKK
jgi:subtilisin family serine protease